MNSFVCALFLATVVVAQPQQYYRRQYFARQVLDNDSEKEATTARAEEAPYPAAGFRPVVEFTLPSRQEVLPPATSYGIPDDSYGAPLRTYTVPHVEYGVPEKAPEATTEATEEEVEVETEATEIVETKEADEDDEKKAKLKEEPKKETEVVSNQGIYYVLLPGAQLQRVQFQTQNDVSNMEYTARLQYSSEGRAPLYVYTAVPQYQPSAYVQLY